MLTKGELNRAVLDELRLRRCEVWQQNNARTRAGFTFKGMPGVPDIIGFQKNTGVFVGCEVKTLNDKMSPAQHALMQKMKKAGAMALVATEDKATGNVVILDYNEYRIKKTPGAKPGGYRGLYKSQLPGKPPGNKAPDPD